MGNNVLLRLAGWAFSPTRLNRGDTVFPNQTESEIVGWVIIEFNVVDWQTTDRVNDILLNMKYEEEKKNLKILL